MGEENSDMRVLAKTEPKPGMTLQEKPIPEPEPDEVRLRVKSVGIDGGVEAPLYQWVPSYQHYEEHLPQVFGHEFAGEVDALGSDVSNYQTGDRVAVEPSIFCGRCRNCREGDWNICTEKSGYGPSGQKSIGIDIDNDGALADYVTVPASNLYTIPDSITYDEGTFLELLAIGVHAVERSDFEAGDRVAVTGPGSVGLSALIAASVGGANEVVMIGTSDDENRRLPIAKKMGATQTVNIEEESLEKPVDVFIEASGHESALKTAEEHTQKGGEIIQIGVYHGKDAVPVNLNHLLNNGISIETIFGRKESSWHRAIAIAEQIDLSPVVGPSYDLEDFEEAFAAENNRVGIKITLNP
ncbi:zinc-dependent alcohol dehydrogenase [Halostagnicola kamekurae]|uniref:L-threonine 3-dehydrogenase n=1 Tax=Halostagnicola kamekurae TaxID=619731 RepID=A0A1I6TS24_9EURY|nr:alcohol dehydrogenase catalytic domain-containing protein [Halostagnicola kamekurae]SFS92029.1 L-threonine 3-dehydrogenase [Halostagnicola kamekurae]